MRPLAPPTKKRGNRPLIVMRGDGTVHEQKALSRAIATLAIGRRAVRAPGSDDIMGS